ncbi:hypothetical protein ILUMI_23234, partial [Ignelater luminosus]
MLIQQRSDLALGCLEKPVRKVNEKSKNIFSERALKLIEQIQAKDNVELNKLAKLPEGKEKRRVKPIFTAEQENELNEFKIEIKYRGLDNNLNQKTELTELGAYCQEN